MHGKQYEVCYAKIAALLLKIHFFAVQIPLWLLQQKHLFSVAAQDKTACPLSEWDFRNKQSG